LFPEIIEPQRLRKVPVILLNARLVQDTTAVAGVMLRNFRAFEGTLLPVFHLEQFDPEDDKETTRGVQT
jgi:hypothetical protein